MHQDTVIGFSSWHEHIQCVRQRYLCVYLWLVLATLLNASWCHLCSRTLSYTLALHFVPLCLHWACLAPVSWFRYCPIWRWIWPITSFGFNSDLGHTPVSLWRDRIILMKHPGFPSGRYLWRVIADTRMERVVEARAPRRIFFSGQTVFMASSNC